MAVNGRDDGAPRRIGLEVAGVAAGVLAAQGVLAAAVARLRGRPIPVPITSVLQAGLLLLSNYLVVDTVLGDALPGMVLDGPGPPFCSADGRWFEIETLDPDVWKAFWSGLGAVPADVGRGWRVFQWRYERATCTLPVSLHHAAAGLALIDLRDAAAAAGASLVPLRDYGAVLDDRDAASSRLRVLPAASTPHGRVATETAEGLLPLSGIRVVEATSRIQGPLAGLLLRMLGADVVRVQPPEGDYGRSATCLHRGKQTIQLDLNTAGGRGDLAALVADADVFLHNWRPGKAAEWRFEADDVAPANRRLVYAHASGWGERRGMAQTIGTDFLVQAHTALGEGLTPVGERPRPSRLVLCDLFGGLVTAEGILAALVRREQLGQGAEVHSSLLAGAMALQEHVLDGIADGREKGRRHGRPLWGLLDQPLPTADGPLAVTVEDDAAFARLCGLCGLDAGAAARSAVEAEVAVRLLDAPASEWEEGLAEAGVPAAAVRQDIASLADDDRLAHLLEPVGIGVAPRAPWCFG